MDTQTPSPSRFASWSIVIVVDAVVFVTILDQAGNADPLARSSTSDLAHATEAERAKVRGLWLWHPLVG